MGQLEPPSTSAASLSRMFQIGRNSRGNWVVKDQKGLCGGLFVDRAEALKFAMFENGNRPQAVIMVPGLDSTKEELQATAEYFLARGAATLAVDGPGQGEAEYHLPIEPAYERVATAVVTLNVANDW